MFQFGQPGDAVFNVVVVIEQILQCWAASSRLAVFANQS
jgi:hypothetical protein